MVGYVLFKAWNLSSFCIEVTEGYNGKSSVPQGNNLRCHHEIQVCVPFVVVIRSIWSTGKITTGDFPIAILMWHITIQTWGKQFSVLHYSPTATVSHCRGSCIGLARQDGAHEPAAPLCSKWSSLHLPNNWIDHLRSSWAITKVRMKTKTHFC